MNLILDECVETAKLGGTSLADKARRDNARKIISGGYDGKLRHDVAVSFRGKKSVHDTKPSDILEKIGQRKDDGPPSKGHLDCITDMLLEDARRDGLIKISVGPHKGIYYADFIPSELRWRYSTRGQISPDAHEVMMISAGEFIEAHMFADSLFALGKPVQLLLPETIPFKFIGALKFGEVPKQSIESLADALGDSETFNIMPGYYGIYLDGGKPQPIASWGNFPRYVVSAIGRGGTDATGLYLTAARAMKLKKGGKANIVVSGNFTDVPGVAVADPRLIENAPYNKVITYDDGLALESKVVHPRALETAKEYGIPILVRRSFTPDENEGLSRGFNPEEEGTLIRKFCIEQDYAKNPNQDVVGIGCKEMNGGYQLTIVGPGIHNKPQIASKVEAALGSIGITPSLAGGGNNHMAFNIGRNLETAQLAVKAVYKSLF